LPNKPTTLNACNSNITQSEQTHGTKKIPACPRAENKTHALIKIQIYILHKQNKVINIPGKSSSLFTSSGISESETIK
jgi:hypothetical protein